MSADSFDIFLWAYTRYTPNYPVEEQRKNFQTLADTLAKFTYWLNKHVKPYIREQVTNDPWEHIRQKFTSETINDNSFFTDEEIAGIEQKLDEFPKYAVEQLQLPVEKMDVLINEVKGLRNDLKGSSKKKWRWQVVGFLYDVTIAVVTDSTKRQLLYNFFKSILEKVSTLPKMLPWP
jgi:hypothetical protein